MCSGSFVAALFETKGEPVESQQHKTHSAVRAHYFAYKFF